MIYACSDIHGEYAAYAALLDRIALKPEDSLYILGDVIDRGNDGVKILLDMMSRPNVIPILGNHELTAAVCLPGLMQEITDQSLADLDETFIAALQEWIINGGAPTFRALTALTVEQCQDILDYLREMALFAQIEAGGRSFVLVHAGLDHFAPDKPLQDYALQDFLYCRPSPEQEFYPERYLVYGHTPTRLLRQQLGEAPSDDILLWGRQIAIDCGCAFGGRLGCLCLDTLETFYT